MLNNSGRTRLEIACPDGHFCAYRDEGYVCELINSQAGVGTGHVDVRSNQVSSVQNRTNNCWLGRDDRPAPLPDHTVLTVHKLTNLSAIDNQNQIDWFDVRSDPGCKE